MPRSIERVADPRIWAVPKVWGNNWDEGKYIRTARNADPDCEDCKNTARGIFCFKPTRAELRIRRSEKWLRRGECGVSPHVGRPPISETSKGWPGAGQDAVAATPHKKPFSRPSPPRRLTATVRRILPKLLVLTVIPDILWIGEYQGAPSHSPLHRGRVATIVSPDPAKCSDLFVSKTHHEGGSSGVVLKPCWLLTPAHVSVQTVCCDDRRPSHCL